MRARDDRAGRDVRRPAPMSYADAVKKARDALAPLPAEQRDNIAYKNLQRLLKLS